MEWVFNINGSTGSSSVFVEVPDSTTPPNVGEKIYSIGGLPGTYFVVEREFIANFPEQHAGDLKFGWAFTISLDSNR